MANASVWILKPVDIHSPGRTRESMWWYRPQGRRGFVLAEVNEEAARQRAALFDAAYGGDWRDPASTCNMWKDPARATCEMLAETSRFNPGDLILEDVVTREEYNRLHSYDIGLVTSNGYAPEALAERQENGDLRAVEISRLSKCPGGGWLYAPEDGATRWHVVPGDGRWELVSMSLVPLARG